MKKIFKKLKELEAKGYYYRVVANPNNIDIKVYLDRDNTSPEDNFTVDNTGDGRYCMFMYLDDFLNKLA